MAKELIPTLFLDEEEAEGKAGRYDCTTVELTVQLYNYPYSTTVQLYN